MKYNIIKTALATMALLLTGCDYNAVQGISQDGYGPATAEAECKIILDSGELLTKASDPDENVISNVNIFIFDDRGQLDYCKYVSERELGSQGGKKAISIPLLLNQRYAIYACANFGFEMKNIGKIKDLLDYRFYMAYPDEYRKGIAMSGILDPVVVRDASEVLSIPLTRMMSKISLQIDRSRLDANITYNVKSVRIGACPKSANVFTDSRVSGEDDIFTSGFAKSYDEVDGLNISGSDGISREVSVYMFENMQGERLKDISEDKDKILDESDALRKMCSYIEIQAEYKSDSCYSMPESYLTYRFYLGGSRTNFDIVRNRHYHFIVSPGGDGLTENSWRVDQSGLAVYGAATLTLHPANYIEAMLGDTVRVWVDLEPENARFEFDKEYLDNDVETGIYDYAIDKDGHGITLYTKKRGTGLLYMEAGTPTSDAALVVLVVN